MSPPVSILSHLRKNDDAHVQLVCGPYFVQPRRPCMPASCCLTHTGSRTGTQRAHLQLPPAQPLPSDSRTYCKSEPQMQVLETLRTTSCGSVTTGRGLLTSRMSLAPCHSAARMRSVGCFLDGTVTEACVRRQCAREWARAIGSEQTCISVTHCWRLAAPPPRWSGTKARRGGACAAAMTDVHG